MAKGELYELACQIIRETDNAVLIHDYASEEEIWIPLSQVESMHKHGEMPCDGTIVMTAWIARQKGLI